MEIKYLGHASFLIKSREVKIVTDPYDPSIGMKFPKIEADVVTISHSHSDHNRADLVGKPVEGNQLVIDMPGEFEKLGARIFGYKSFHDKKQGAERGEIVMYKVEIEGMSVLHCGDLGCVPDDAFLDSIGEVDVLLVPVGGFHTINPDEAAELIKKIEPAIAVPMHYNHSKLNQKVFSQVAPLSEFLKKFGLESLPPVPKLVVRKEELEQEMKIIVMEISN